MPSFVNMASLTKLSSITGNEEFQVSATNKISSRDIASLALTQQLHGLSEVTIGSPKISSTSLLLSAIAALYRLSSDNGKILPISNGIDKFGNVVFHGTNAVGILFDVKASKYFTRSGVTAAAFFNSAQWISWLQDGEAHEMDGGTGVADPIQIHNFAEVTAIDNWPTPKDGLIIPFVTDSGVLNKPGNESEYVGIIICEVDTQNTGRAEVIAYGSGTGACYVGLLDYASVSIEWRVNKLSVASRKLSAFTESAIFEYIYQGDDGDVFPFTTINATKSTANQFPANGLFTGIISKGSNEGDYFNILAFRNGSNEVYVGSCIGSTTQWTLVGGSGGTPSGGIAPGTVIFNDEFTFDGTSRQVPGQLVLMTPIPLGSIVTFMGSIYWGPQGDEILLSPDNQWSLTMALPSGSSDVGEVFFKNMMIVPNPSASELVVDAQESKLQVKARDVVNGKINSLSLFAQGAMMGDAYLTITQIVYVSKV